MIDRIAGNKVLPGVIRSDIAERADGVPLFAEEIAKATVEAANEGKTARAITAIPLAVQGVPASHLVSQSPDHPASYVVITRSTA